MDFFGKKTREKKKGKAEYDSGPGPSLVPDLGPALVRPEDEPPPPPGSGRKPPPFQLAGAVSITENFGYGVRWSLSFHVFLAVFVLFKALVFPGTIPPFVPTLRVDLVGLPDALKKDLRAPNPANDPITQALKQAEEQARKIKEAEEPKAPPEKSKTKDAPAAPDEMALKPKKTALETANREKRLKNALERIKSLSKINAEEETPQAAAPLLKGNRVSHGSSIAGDAREGETTYPEMIREKLHKNWSLPIVLLRQNLSAQVRVFIDAYGRVPRFIFTKSSGNPKFDDEVKKAILSAQPFARPPAELASALMDGGIEFGFPL